jgi:hypothetical protein
LDVIKIAIAVHIIEVGTLCMIDEQRMAPYGSKSPYRAIDTSWEERLCLLKQFP